LSTTYVLKVLPTATDRYWYALQQRELMSITNAMVFGSILQWCHEVVRLWKRLRVMVYKFKHGRRRCRMHRFLRDAIDKAYGENLQLPFNTPASVCRGHGHR